jgi:DNA-binding MarR family transcriptional regulator
LGILYELKRGTTALDILASLNHHYKISYNKSTIHSALKRLKDAGLVEISGKSQPTTERQGLMPSLWKVTSKGAEMAGNIALDSLRDAFKANKPITSAAAVPESPQKTAAAAPPAGSEKAPAGPRAFRSPAELILFALSENPNGMTANAISLKFKDSIITDDSGNKFKVLSGIMYRAAAKLLDSGRVKQHESVAGFRILTITDKGRELWDGIKEALKKEAAK